MDNKIEALTKKLYNEGIEKARTEAESILAEAKKKAAEIIQTAQSEAQKISSAAAASAEESKRNTNAEIKLSVQQALDAVKQQITNLICAKVIDASASQSLSNPAVLKEFISAAVQNWKAADSRVQSLDVVLPESKKQELEAAMKNGAGSVLKDGITVSFSKSMKGGFRIGPSGAGYLVNFTDEDFAELFKQYLKPRTRELLFGE